MEATDSGTQHESWLDGQFFGRVRLRFVDSPISLDIILDPEAPSGLGFGQSPIAGEIFPHIAAKSQVLRSIF